jgi:hypothetical protein
MHPLSKQYLLEVLPIAKTSRKKNNSKVRLKPMEDLDIMEILATADDIPRGITLGDISDIQLVSRHKLPPMQLGSIENSLEKQRKKRNSKHRASSFLNNYEVVTVM